MNRLNSQAHVATISPRRYPGTVTWMSETASARREIPSQHPPTYWHGLGLCVDPFAVNDIDPRCKVTDPLVLASRRADPHRDVDQYTYASTDKDVALAFSVLARGAMICEVDPQTLAPALDPDFPTLSVRFRGTLKVLSKQSFKHATLPHARRITELLAVDRLSAPNCRWHHPDGRIQPPPLWRSWGYTEDDFDWLGSWFPDDSIWQIPVHQLVHAIAENGDWLTIWPTARPLPPKAARRKPNGTLTDQWKTPGHVPDMQTLATLSQARQTVLMPWEW